MDPSPPASVASFKVKHSFYKNEDNQEGYMHTATNNTEEEGTKWLDNFYNVSAFSADSMDQLNDPAKTISDDRRQSLDRLSSVSNDFSISQRSAKSHAGSIESFIKKHTDEPNTIVSRLKEMERLRKVLSRSFDDCDHTSSESSAIYNGNFARTASKDFSDIISRVSSKDMASRAPSRDGGVSNVSRSPSHELRRTLSLDANKSNLNNTSSRSPSGEIRRVSSKEIRRASPREIGVRRVSSKAEDEQNMLLGASNEAYKICFDNPFVCKSTCLLTY
jgi:hypothetical protein